MEISGSAAAGALRVGIQIISNHRRPVLEFYHEVQNQYGPEQDLGGISRRFQDVFVSFTLVNIGSIRAEDVCLSKGGAFERDRGRAFGGAFEEQLNQVASGQILFLFRLDRSELHYYEPEPDRQSSKMAGVKREELRLRAEYNGPWQGFNRVARLWSKIRRRKQYHVEYVFKPTMISGDLPPPRYA